MEKKYDYIISGAGAAGLSLLMRMMAHPLLASKKILVIDKAPKDTNDHTWCFWEKGQGLFEPIVHHHWNAISFFSKDYECKKALAPYKYKMIRSKDLYAYVYEKAGNNKNVQFIYADVQAFSDHGHEVSVITSSGSFTATHIFNSIILHPLQPAKGKHLLLQHFKGWFIHTEQPVFDSTTATFMDFRVSQEHGTTFVYVLPTSEREALVEYTLFSDKLLDESAYDLSLSNYVQSILNVDKYDVKETEFGIIPMTNIAFPAGSRNIHQVGTAGNWTKASTGFTFQFIQKNTAILVDRLARELPIPHNLFANKRFDFYDATFLNVLGERKMAGEKIFATMFEKNSIEEIFRFLDNESSIADDISIMKNLPIATFARAGWEEIIK